MNIKDFYRFTGVQYGDTIDQVFDIFGVPNDEYKNPDNSYFVFYYEMCDEYALNISFNAENFKIESVFLGLHSYRAVRFLLDKFKITEPKASFIGNSMDEIIDVFGLPDEWHRNFIAYRQQDLEVEFYCPRDEKSLCRRIKVKWFY